jgi:hypothetical protein
MNVADCFIARLPVRPMTDDKLPVFKLSTGNEMYLD